MMIVFSGPSGQAVREVRLRHRLSVAWSVIRGRGVIFGCDVNKIGTDEVHIVADVVLGNVFNQDGNKGDVS